MKLKSDRVRRRLVRCVLLFGLTVALLPGASAQNPTDGFAVIDAADYPSLQAAFDAVPDSGGVVYIPPGRYEIDEPLVLGTGNTRIEGAGAASHIVNRDTTGRPALLVRHPAADTTGGRCPCLWGVQLVDFRVSGNAESGDGIQMHEVDELYIRGLTVERNGRHGINLISCYENPRVTENNITYNAEAGLNIVAGHDVVVSGNEFEENKDAVRYIDGFNLAMSGNNIDDHLRHGVVIENTYGSVLSGNMIEESQGTAIILDRDCYGITIGSNVIAHNFSGGVDLRDAWGISLSSNTFTIVSGFSVRVGPQSGRVAITGNNFSNAYIGGERRRDDVAAGIALIGTSGIAVTGNVFAGIDESAVRFEGDSEHVVIVGNTMLDLSVSAPGRYPAIQGAPETTTIDSNVIAPDSH